MSTKMTVQAKVPAKDDKPEMNGSVEVTAPETIKEAVEMFGENAVLSNALANWRVTLQGNIRSALRRGEDQATMASRLASAKMGVAVQKGTIDPEQAFLAKFQNATPEEKKEMIKKLQAQAKG